MFIQQWRRPEKEQPPNRSSHPRLALNVQTSSCPLVSLVKDLCPSPLSLYSLSISFLLLMRRERRPARRYFINTNELHQVHRRARNSQNTQASDDTAALMKGIKDSDVPEDGRRLSLCFSERERAQQQFPWRPKSMLWQRRREREDRTSEAEIKRKNQTSHLGFFS